jgi:hypothetical protein
MKNRHALALATLLLLGIFALPKTSNAQAYKNALGLRLGSPVGLTCKHLFTEKHGFEGIVGSRGRSLEIIGLYEYHIYPAKRAPEFDLYFGGGAHVGFYGSYRDRDYFGPGSKPRGRVWGGRPYWAYNDPYVGVGLDGIIGCSYTFKNAPINIGFDYKPAFAFLTYVGYMRGDAAISLRFVL